MAAQSNQQIVELLQNSLPSGSEQAPPVPPALAKNFGKYRNPNPTKFESPTETHPCGVEYYIGFIRTYTVTLSDGQDFQVIGKNRDEARELAARVIDESRYTETFPDASIAHVEAHNPYRFQVPPSK